MVTLAFVITIWLLCTFYEGVVHAEGRYVFFFLCVCVCLREKERQREKSEWWHWKTRVQSSIGQYGYITFLSQGADTVEKGRKLIRDRHSYKYETRVNNNAVLILL